MGGVGYPKFGVLFSSNITPDSATGIGSWTDDEIARAIALGIRKNGDTLFPIMPYYEYNKMSKEDIYSIVAYLRTLKPIANKIPDRKLKTPAGPLKTRKNRPEKEPLICSNSKDPVSLGQGFQPGNKAVGGQA